MVTDKGTLWPRVIFWIGFALAIAALVGYLVEGPAGGDDG